MIEYFSLIPSSPILLLLSPPPPTIPSKLQTKIAGPECLYLLFSQLGMPFLFHQSPNPFSLFTASLMFQLK